MCLVSVCPKGTSKKIEDIESFIRSGYKSNSSGGSGFAYKKNNDNYIYIKKGYSNVEKLIEDIKNLRLTINDELMIHHRIATSGKTDKYNTHPFVMSDNHDEVCAYNIKTDKPVLMHNGIFSIDEYEDRNTDMSDTYAFARYIMSNEHLINLLKTNVELFEYCLKGVLRGNKVAFLFPDRDFEVVGDFTIDKGYYHSNGGYCRYVHNVGGVEDDNPFTENGENIYSMINSKLGEEADRRNQLLLDFKRSVEDNKTSISKNNTKIVLLDKAYIQLGKNNIRHFRYAKKTDWDSGKKILLEIGSSFDFGGMFVPMAPISENKVTSYKSIKSEDLEEDYYYIPKPLLYEIYNDYKILIDSSLQVTKTLYKKLCKRLDNHHSKKPNEKILFKRLNNTFCKKSLEMYKKDMEIILQINSTTRKTVKPNTNTTKVLTIHDEIDEIDNINNIVRGLNIEN